jgi:adenylate cyclase
MGDTLPTAYLETEIAGTKKQFPLASDRVCRIGRSDRNTVVLDDDLASRNHSMLQRSETGAFYITDLGSSNGTFVNGARISVPVILRAGDRITIGSHEFLFYQEQVAAPPAPEPDADELKSTSIFFAQKLITVLVVDIRDFTGLAQRIDAETLSQITCAFFRDAGKELQERGACAQKYIGDAVMSVWLHKRREPELGDLANVFGGLLKLIEIAATLQHHFNLAAPIHVGSGINTGWASVGNVGSIATSDYTALGDVVNKAFRLESATKDVPCDILLGQETLDFLCKISDAPRLFQPHMVRLKGYDDPMPAFGAHFDALKPLIDSLERSRTATG